MKAQTIFQLGLLLAFVGIGLQIMGGDNLMVVGTSVSTIGIILTLRGYIMERSPDRMKKDERSKKISAWAASYSWITMIFVLLAIFWINKFQIFQFSVDAVVGIVYIAMVVSLIVFKYYFNNKGDVL
jgi:hypothetical protein